MFSGLTASLFGSRRGSQAENSSRDDLETASVYEKQPWIKDGPSVVSWIPPSRSEPSLVHAPSIGRSASSPSLLHDASKRPRSHRHGSFSHAQSSRPLTFTFSREQESVSAVGMPVEGLPTSKPLSPVMERKEELRPLAIEPVVIAQPLPQFTAIGHEEAAVSPASAHSAFIRRPLKRTISQTSSLHTLRNGASVSVPILPPLALGPNLSAAVSTIGTPTSQPHAPSPHKVWGAPNSAVTPATTRYRMSDVSEEADAQSFVTALSVNERARGDPFADPRASMRPSVDVPTSVREFDIQSTYTRSFANVDTQSMASRSMFFGDTRSLADVRTIVDEGEDADAEDSAHEPAPIARPMITQPPKALTRISFAPRLDTATTSAATPMPLSSTTPSNMAERSTAYLTSQGPSPRNGLSVETVARAPQMQAVLSNSSSMVDRRWHFGRWSTASAGKPARGSLLEKLPEKVRQVDVVKLLFWMGFVAGPWCWLVGGWLIRSRLPPAQTGSVLPTWFANQAQQNGVSPEVASSIFKMDPWVRRCRLAAAIGSCILVVTLLLATIVLATAR